MPPCLSLTAFTVLYLMVRNVYPIFTPVTAHLCASHGGYRLFTVGIIYRTCECPVPRFFIRGTLAVLFPGDNSSRPLMWSSGGLHPRPLPHGASYRLSSANALYIHLDYSVVKVAGVGATPSFKRHLPQP
jgi:hypothetical protein